MKSQIHDDKENKLQQLSKNSITKLALILLSAGSLSAQDKKMCTSISVNMNSGSSSSEGVSKNFGLNPNIGVNLFWGKVGAGLDVGTFNSSPAFDFAGYAQQSLGTVKRVMIPTDRETSRSTYFLVGPQYAIRKGKMNIILSTKAGVTMNKMAEFQVIDELSTKTLASYQAPEDFIRNAFTIKPSLSIGYDLTKSFSLTANAQFVKQTGQQDFTTAYRDLSDVQTTDLKGNPLRQPEITKNIINSPVISSSTKGASEFMSFGLGLTYTIRATGKHFKDATLSMSANKEDNSGTQATEAGTKIATGKHFKDATLSMSANKEDNSGTQTTEVATKIATGKHFKDATILMAANKEDNSGSTTTDVAQVSGEAAQTAGWKIPENTKVIVNPGSGSGNENTSESTKAKQSEAKSNLKAMNGSGEASKTAGWNTRVFDKVIVNPGSGSGNENTSESTKAKQSEAKSNLKANSESVNYDENNPPKPLQAAGIPGIKTKAIKKVGEVPLGKMKSSNNEDNPPQPAVTTNSVDIETLLGITEGTPIKGIIVKGGKNPGGSINPDAGNTTGTDNVNNYKIKMTDVSVTLAKVNDKGGEDASIKESEKPKKEVAHTPMKRSKTSEARSNLKSTKKSKPVKGQTKRGGKSSEAKLSLK